MLQSYLHILRVFGLSGAEMAALLRSAQEEGCPGLRLLERDGEYAVCIQVSAPTRQMAHEHCEKWVQRLRPRFGHALFAEGEVSLAQATLDALLRKRRLLVAADATTGRLLGDALSPLEHSEAAFDFGHETYADTERAKRIATPAVLLKKFPGDQLQATAGRCAAALQLSDADVAVAWMPASVGQAPFVLLCDRTGALARAVDPESSDALLANQLLDLVRRRVLNLPEAKGVISFRPGHDRPLLPAFENGDYKESDTTRFSLRRTAKGSTQRFEPMLDFDAPAAPKAGGITFEGEDAPEAPEPVRAPAAPPAPAKPVPAPRRQPQPSLLDEDIPDFTAPAPRRAAPPAKPKPQHAGPDMQRAANLLYDRETLDDSERAAARSRSLAKVERAERRQKILVITLLLLFLVLLAGGGFALWRYARGSLGRQPQARNYGTSRHDEQAQAYLAKAREKREGVLGYLAFPGMEGQLLYATREAADAAGEESGDALPALVSASYLGSAAPGHTVIDYRGALPELFELENLQENSGFTLYLPDATYRYKVMAVYELDLAQTEDTFNPATYGDLSSYYDYMAFTLGARMRSQFDTGVQPGQGASFLTLTALDTSDGTMLCVTGRQLRETESAQLSAGAVRAAEQPLMPASYYAANGQEAPNAAALLADQLQSYAADRSAIEEQASGNATNSDQLLNELGDAVADMQQQTSDLMNKADEMILLGLTDIAGESGAAESDLNQGAEGSLPEQEVEVPVTTEPTAEPNPVDGSSEGEQPPEEEPTAPEQSGAPSGGTSAEGETINVTMNGAAQTMDLVRCLAMVAQNELGPNAPMEAYKAQCVATHCWILSQGGYPSVLGAEPGANALAAAQEVAHVLVTYNGKVAFTPYFASASTGTASSADVWGGDRPYLQPVDSPYDKDVATHWNTNGATSGTARFARTTLLERFKEKLEIDLTDVDPNDWFHILSANAYGWVGRIQVGPDSGPNTSMRGTYFRETLLAGQSVDGRSLRSQCFTVTYDGETDCFIFDVYGYGHGVGMSQWGAVGYARNGWSYDQILTHYFTGTTLTTY